MHTQLFACVTVCITIRRRVLTRVKSNSSSNCMRIYKTKILFLCIYHLQWQLLPLFIIEIRWVSSLADNTRVQVNVCACIVAKTLFAVKCQVHTCNAKILTSSATITVNCSDMQIIWQRRLMRGCIGTWTQAL